jgi:membrane protein implicated in regulation of membrane protease activity
MWNGLCDRTFCVGIPGKEMPMFGMIAAVLVVLWLLGFLAFHVAGGLIHLLLVVAVIMVVIHFVSGRRAV